MDRQTSSPKMIPEGADPRFDLLLEAIDSCVRANGLGDVTVEGVAQVSGISRATLFRKFGSREAMLKAYLVSRSSRLIEIGQRIANEPGNLGERLENILAFMV